MVKYYWQLPRAGCWSTRRKPQRRGYRELVDGVRGDPRAPRLRLCTEPVSSSQPPSIGEFLASLRPRLRLCRSNCSRSYIWRRSRSLIFCSRSRRNADISVSVWPHTKMHISNRWIWVEKMSGRTGKWFWPFEIYFIRSRYFRFVNQELLSTQVCRLPVKP